MKIYIRTEEGQKAAYSPDSALPRKLKSILKVVDGKTHTSVFQKNLQSFGDVEALLLSLEIAGLLEMAPSANAGKPVHPKAGLPDQEPPLQLRDWTTTQIPTQSGTPSKPANLELLQRNSHLPSTSSSAATAAMNAYKNAALVGVLDEMASFVLQHLPEQSFYILKEIEDIQSVEILAATFGGYEQMVSSTGQLGHQHVRSIKHTLQNYL